MFDSLRKSFTRFSKTLAEKDLSESDVEEILEDLEMSLLQSDVALEVVEEISSDLKRKIVGTSVNKKQLESFVKGALTESISQLFQNTGSLDLLERIHEKSARDEPYAIVFLGINGTGKTTTLAKFAHMLKKNDLTVAIAAADTFRAGAIEQIREHGEKLQVKVIAQNYNSDPAAVCRDTILYAKSHRINCVLIDTAGRIQTNTNLMQQIEKITKVVKPDLKIFVGDSLAGNDAISQAREFYEYTNFDCSILTKSDADTKGGSALSIVKITSKPILYLGVGQEYTDLKEFKWGSFVSSILGESDGVDGETAEKIQTVLKAATPTESTDVDSSPKAGSVDILESNTKVETVVVDGYSAKKPESTYADPFEGISNSDIATYSDVYDVPPPESDEAAHTLAANIKEWINQGRPALGDAQDYKEQAADKRTDDGPMPDMEYTDMRQEVDDTGKVTHDTKPTVESEPQSAMTGIGADTPVLADGQPTESEVVTEQKPKGVAPKDESIMQEPDSTGVAGEATQEADPFEGISNSDIATYSDVYDVPPPESDEAAHTLAANIKEWINQGRPALGDDVKSKVAEQESQDAIDDTVDGESVPDEEESKIKDMSEKEVGRKHKKKRGMFGFFRR